MKRYYISHPYTGNEEWNKADAENIRAALKAKYPKKCFINPLGMFGSEDADYCVALDDALELLSCCDAIILCPGWEKSTGCCVERDFAIKLGIEIEYFNEETPEDGEYINFIRSRLFKRTQLEQLAEEAAELGKAALKLRSCTNKEKSSIIKS